MKILPKKIVECSIVDVDNSQGIYGIYLKSTNKSNIISGKARKLESLDILKDLISKNAYATSLLYFVENFDIDKSIDKNNLLEDINVLLHSRCKVVNEKAPLLTKIDDYPIYEGSNYILRGEGNNKIKESFDLKEDVDIDKITLDYIKNLKYDDVIKDFVVCPKCKNVFEEDALMPDYNDYPDDYDGPIDNDPISVTCPYCNYFSKDEEDFRDAWIEDLEDAPNADEYVPGLRQYIDTLEEDGTQAADIASKVDYSFQSAPTPANPSKKKKYESVEIKELDENTYLNLTGFIKDVDGFYKRGNYILVKESATNELKVIHKSKLNEVAEPIEQVKGSEGIVKYLDKKLNDKFPNRFKIKSGPVDDAFGLVITDDNNHDAGDLIDVTDFINATMKYLGYDKSDYEIDYKRNNLIMAIYNDRYFSKQDFAK